MFVVRLKPGQVNRSTAGLLIVQGKYGRRKEAERFGKELEVGLFSEFVYCRHLGNMELNNLLREHLLVNPGHLNFPAIARPVAVLFAVIGRFLKQVENACSFLNRICDWLS